MSTQERIERLRQTRERLRQGGGQARIAKQRAAGKSTARERLGLLFDPETSRYLTVIAEEHVFPKPYDAGKHIAGLNSVQAVLEAAMQAEKDSVLFYDELATRAKFAEARDVFRLLKGEEQVHVVKLREMIEAWA